MEQNKTVPNKFGIWDYPLLVDYLEAMAADGWLLTKYHEKTLEFKATAPKQLKFAVTFFREYNYAGHTPPEDLVYMWQVLETDGWHNVTHNNYIQVFYNENPHCTPFHTDAAVQLANFDMLMQASLLKKWQYCALWLAVFMAVRGVATLRAIFTAQLTKSEMYTTLCFMIPVGGYLVWELGYNLFRKFKYQQWYRQALVVAEEQNEFLVPYENNFYSSLHFAVTVVFAVTFLAALFTAGGTDVNIFGVEGGLLYAMDYIHIFILSRIRTSVTLSRAEDDGAILPVREKYPTGTVLLAMFAVIVIYLLAYAGWTPNFF